MADVGDEDGLFGALVKLVDDPQCRVRMGQRARAFVERNHSLEALPGKLSDLYRRVLSTPHSLNSSPVTLNAESMAGKRP